jgi:hypothetical protein
MSPLCPSQGKVQSRPGNTEAAISGNKLQCPMAMDFKLQSGFPTSPRTRTFLTDFAVSCDQKRSKSASQEQTPENFR